MGYSHHVIRGVSWMTGFRMITRALAFLKIAVIARALTPAQFGLFGIASLVLSFLEILTETGINIILIQAKHDIHKYINSAWVVSIVRGVLISIGIVISSPIISSFFNSPDSLGLVLFISLIPLARGFINPSIIKFQKELRFRDEFLFRTSIFLFDALMSILFVLIFRSPYGLVTGMLAGVLLEIFLSFVLVKPWPKFVMEKEHLHEVFHKGKWITAHGIFDYFAKEGDDIVVGRLLGTAPLGIYQMAYKISTLPISEVTDVMGKVVFPVYSKIEGDIKRLRKAFIKSTVFIGITAILIGSFIMIFPELVISILLGERWLQAKEVLRVLALYGILRAIFGSASTVFLAVEKQKYVTIMTFLRFSALAITIFPLVSLFGMMGAGYSALISVLVEIPLIVYYLSKVLKR